MILINREVFCRSGPTQVCWSVETTITAGASSSSRPAVCPSSAAGPRSSAGRRLLTSLRRRFTIEASRGPSARWENICRAARMRGICPRPSKDTFPAKNYHRRHLPLVKVRGRYGHELGLDDLRCPLLLSVERLSDGTMSVRPSVCLSVPYERDAILTCAQKPTRVS